MVFKHFSLYGIITFSFLAYAGGKAPQVQAPRIPVIFHSDYDISLLGLEKLHPFDSCKYGKVFQMLKKQYQKSRFYTPEKVSTVDLLKVHSQAYLDSLSNSSVIAQITEIPLLAYVPNFILQRYFMNSMKLATGGTVLAAQRALQDGWAINLSGGYHHAKHDCGGGFCAFSDIPLAIVKLWEKNPELKVMIVDLDAHQGNGHESYFANDERVVIYDVYNDQIYPRDHESRARIDYNYPVNSGIKDAEYLELLEDTLPAAIEESKPHFIIYNAGTDIFEKDPLGRMKITAEGIRKRDAMVFECAQKNNIPVLMVLSGGYTQESAHIIGNSILNILKTILKIV
eukprot:NODE_759_length_4494_cov_0.059841.p2 type:complete len:341 gc:universal NODE_759_length_4494_cov_0.059841:164-1186(+)